MILKQVIRYTNADALEATWVTREQLPDVDVPESFGPTTRDEDGNLIPGEVIPAHIVPGGILEIVVKCQAYANSQMDLLAADLGADAQQYQALMDEVAATYVPPVFDLGAARLAKNAEINAARLKANRSSFTHAGKAFACDELSRSDIDGITSFVTLAGALPPGWPGGWKAIDNSYHPIGAVGEWAAFVGSMVAAGNANFAKSQALKTQLAAATTAEQINAIAW